ncbi:D-alanyl-D-alanine carboxypeptidase family protein [Actinotalea sp.]|uniref:M15 family metallopeptidase n=1 Tax=Actinotalea sp. TaxID=1872145 RepID=UPI0035638977
MRAFVVGFLAVGTIGVPAFGAIGSDTSGAGAELAGSSAPSAFSVLSAAAVESTPTSLLAPLPEVSRDAVTVSRSVDRNPLPTCDPSVDPGPANGQIATDDLCTLWDGTNMLRGDAAVAMSALNEDFTAAMGEPLCITDSYRTLAEQQRLAYTKPGLAAAPGTSNHGWGLAVDLCSSVTYNSAKISWLTENGPTYGWANPAWARAGGSGAYEPWHWEYVPGTEAKGTNWD